MNSKGLKNKLVCKVVGLNGEVIYDFSETIDKIEQYLEILEILKKHITIENCYAYETLGINLTSVEEDFKKVKEWLESE